MPGTSDSKLEAIGPVRVDIAPVLIVVGVTPGEPVAAAHAALVAASGRTAAVALADGTITAPAATTEHAPALAARRAMPFRLVFIASPSFQLIIKFPPVRILRSVLLRPQRGHCSCTALGSSVATHAKPPYSKNN